VSRFRAAEKLTQRDGANGLAQLALGVQKIKAKQFAAAALQVLARRGELLGLDLLHAERELGEAVGPVALRQLLG
jgi:hypothetical protein